MTRAVTTGSSCAALVAGVVLLCAALPAAATRIVCWTNADGVRECGNAVPPEYAQQGSEQKSTQGITVNRTSRAKTAEELAAERAEQERIEKDQAERARREAAQAQYDRVLLATFTTEEDLRLTRDGKIAAIDSRIKHSQQVGRKLAESLEALEADAAKMERGGKPVSEDLQQQISGIRAQISENEDDIDRRRKEKVALDAQFESDLARYRQLKAASR